MRVIRLAISKSVFLFLKKVVKTVCKIFTVLCWCYVFITDPRFLQKARAKTPDLGSPRQWFDGHKLLGIVAVTKLILFSVGEYSAKFLENCKVQWIIKVFLTVVISS